MLWVSDNIGSFIGYLKDAEAACAKGKPEVLVELWEHWIEVNGADSHNRIRNFAWGQYVDKMEVRVGTTAIGDKVAMTEKQAVQYWHDKGMSLADARAKFKRRLCGDEGDEWERGSCADTSLPTVDNFVIGIVGFFLTSLDSV